MRLIICSKTNVLYYAFCFYLLSLEGWMPVLSVRMYDTYIRYVCKHWIFTTSIYYSKHNVTSFIYVRFIGCISISSLVFKHQKCHNSTHTLKHSMFVFFFFQMSICVHISISGFTYRVCTVHRAFDHIIKHMQGIYQWFRFSVTTTHLSNRKNAIVFQTKHKNFC